QYTAGVAGGQRLPALPTGLEFGLVDEQIEGAAPDVEADPVAVAHERDRPAVDGLRRDVSDTQAGRATREASVSHEQDVLAETRALDGPGDREHLPHPGT